MKSYRDSDSKLLHLDKHPDQTIRLLIRNIITETYSSRNITYPCASLRAKFAVDAAFVAVASYDGGGAGATTARDCG